MFTINDRVTEHRYRGRRPRLNMDLEWDSISSVLAGPSWNQSSGQKGHAAGVVRHNGEEGEKNRINVSMAYSLVLGKCTKYLRSRLEGQEKC